MTTPNVSEEVLQARRQITEFFVSTAIDVDYDKVLEEIVAKKARLFPVNVNDIRNYDPQLVDSIFSDPYTFIPAFEDVIQERVRRIDPTYNPDIELPIRVSFSSGSFGARDVNPRQLSASMLRGMYRVSGIVTRATLPQPRLVKTVHYNPERKALSVRTYSDSLTSLTTGSGGGLSLRPMAEDGTLLSTEYGLSTFQDHQTLVVQEAPETAPPGRMPRSIPVILLDQLVDAARPGDRVMVTGVYNPMGSTAGIQRSALCRSALLANSVTVKRTVDTPSDTSMDEVKAWLADMGAHALDTLADSLAPSIFGHETIKRVLILQLLGGGRRELPSGLRVRGDINVLLVGDPGTGKSQLLRVMMQMLPTSVATTGRGSSGAGLTAAVLSDKKTGSRHLEAGAMVLADGGLILLDEFDKMTDQDRTAIHEAMEQQTVSIAKAGIQATLNARCSVLAAANPIYGMYDARRSPSTNIGLPDTLLSRFDCLFVVLDRKEPELDRKVAKHVLASHSGASSRATTPQEQGTWLRYNAPMHQPYLEAARSRGNDADPASLLVSPTFLKHLVQYCRSLPAPSINPDAAAQVADMYAELRHTASGRASTVPVTARILETIFRMSTARARLRVPASNVTVEDVTVAYGLLRQSLFSETAEEAQRHVQQSIEIDKGGRGALRRIIRVRTRRSRREEAEDEFESSEEAPATTAAAPAGAGLVSESPATGDAVSEDIEEEPAAPAAVISDQRFIFFRSLLGAWLEESRQDECGITALMDHLNVRAEVLEQPPLEVGEVRAALARLEEDNMVTVDDDIAYFSL